MEAGGEGQQELFRILAVYAKANPHVRPSVGCTHIYLRY
jgi:hypothetical protein